MTTATTTVPVLKPVSPITLAFGAVINKGQLAFAASIAFETLPMIVENPKFKFAPYARRIEEASNYSIAGKTVQNCATLANQLQMKFGAKIGSYVGAHTKANVSDFVNFVSDQVKDTTYRLTLEDLIAFCKGELSAQDKRAAAAAAAAEAALAMEEAKAKAAAAELTAETDKIKADADKIKQDSEKAKADAGKAAAEAEAKSKEQEQAKADADKLAESLKADKIKAEADKAEAEQREAKAKADAEVLRKEQESFAVRVTVNADGSPNVVVALNPNPAFLREVAKQLSAMAKSLEQQAAQAMKIAA